MEIQLLKTQGIEFSVKTDHKISVIQSLVVNQTGGSGSGMPDSEAENVMLVGGTAGTWLQKTIAQIKTLLGLKTAAYTESTDYAAASHTHSYEPANSNIQNHISDSGVHVATGEKATWNGKQDVLGFTPSPLRPVTEKITLVDADEVSGNNSENSFSQIRTTWTNVKSFLKTYFDTLYASKTSKWVSITATYSAVQEFTMAGTQQLAYEMIGTLFTCTSADGNTRRIGYIINAVYSNNSITVTVTTDTDLSATDISYKFTPRIYFHYFAHATQCVNELIADANSQVGIWFANTKFDSYLLNVDASVLSPASGAGASVVFNVYKNATALFSSAPDLGTNSILVNQRPTTKEISATENVSIRITSVGGTTRAANFQARLTIVPQSIYLSAV